MPEITCKEFVSVAPHSEEYVGGLQVDNRSDIAVEVLRDITTCDFVYKYFDSHGVRVEVSVELPALYRFVQFTNAWDRVQVRCTLDVVNEHALGSNRF